MTIILPSSLIGMYNTLLSPSDVFNGNMKPFSNSTSCVSFWKCNVTSILADAATSVNASIVSFDTFIANTSALSLIKSPVVYSPSHAKDRPFCGHI